MRLSRSISILSFLLVSLTSIYCYLGKQERQSTFDPIIMELHRLLPVNESNAFQNRVLVPGTFSGMRV